MRRFGDAESFLNIIDSIRSRCPEAGFRSNFITGFPGETDADVAVLADFLQRARLDVAGIFAYSDEEGTEAAGLPGHLDGREIAARVEAVTELSDVLMAARAERWVGKVVDVLLERATDVGAVGRIAQQGPEADGETMVMADRPLAASQLVRVGILDTDGVDLCATVVAPGILSVDVAVDQPGR
jgi:tRNA A37 methylthiotransferase MiaB